MWVIILIAYYLCYGKLTKSILWLLKSKVGIHQPSTSTINGTSTSKKSINNSVYTDYMALALDMLKLLSSTTTGLGFVHSCKFATFCLSFFNWMLNAFLLAPEGDKLYKSKCDISAIWQETSRLIFSKLC